MCRSHEMNGGLAPLYHRQLKMKAARHVDPVETGPTPLARTSGGYSA